MRRKWRQWRARQRRFRLLGLAAVALLVIVGAPALVGAVGQIGSDGSTVTNCAPGYGDPVYRDAAGLHCTLTSSSTTSSTTSTTSTSTTTTTLPPPPPPSGCAAAARTVTGDQSAKWSSSITGTLDASRATWRSSRVGDYAVSVFGSTPGACWSGGTILGEWPQSDAWDLWHYRGGFRAAQPNMTAENLRITNYGDCAKTKDDGGGIGQNFTLRAALAQDCHDDFLENDYLHTVHIVDTLINGTYVGISARASSGQGTDGHTETVTVDRSLLWLKPMQAVYKGASPGTGGFFKWGGAESPKLAIFDSVFRADQAPNHGSLGLPAVPVSCARNVILWTASSAFPEAASWKAKCPDTTIVTGTAARALWDAAAANWLSHH